MNSKRKTLDAQVASPGAITTELDIYEAGELTIQGGGSLKDDTMYLGASAGAKVTGSGSILDSVSVSVGDTGPAGLSIENEGELDTYYVTLQGGSQMGVHGGGLVNESGDAYIGYEDEETNTLVIEGPASTWNNAGVLYIGYDSSGVLVITNGGTVYYTEADIGDGMNYGEGTVVVGAGGSLLNQGDGGSGGNDGDLLLGSGGDASLTITGGGVVTDTNGFVGYDGNVLATVDGHGSVWTNWGGLQVVDGGQLIIANGATVYDTNGDAEGGATMVTGTNSLWLNASNLLAGGLTISNGAVVEDDTGTSSGDVVDGSGSLWSNQTSLAVSGELIITNGGRVVSGDYGLIDDFIAGYTGPVTGYDFCKIRVAGTNSSLFCNAVNLDNGNLFVTGGGFVDAFGVIVATNVDLISTLVVDGPGSASSNLFVEVAVMPGANGAVVVTNGGIINALEVYLGYDANAQGNLTVYGTNSLLHAFDLYLGTNESYGTAAVYQGGQVSTHDTSLSSQGEIIVSDAGSVWTNMGALTVGDPKMSAALGRDEENLQVLAGGWLGDNSAYIDEGCNAVVDGAGSVWANAANLQVGVDTSGDLTVSGGGTVSVSNNLGTIYVAPGFESVGTVQIGADGPGGTLAVGSVQLGGLGSLVFDCTDKLYVFAPLIAGDGEVGQLGGNVVAVTGNNTYAGGTLIQSGVLQVGNNGTSGTLGTGTVTNNGALVFDRSDIGWVPFTNVIAGSGVVTQRSGYVSLGGVNTYKGATTITGGGTLVLGAESALGLNPGTIAESQLILDNGTLESINDFAISGSNRGITLGPGGGTFSPLGGTTLTLQSPWLNGAGTLKMEGPGTLVMNNAITAYGGDTLIDDGTLQQGKAFGLAGGATAGNVTVSAGATLDLGGYSLFINGLNGSGTVDNTKGPGIYAASVGNNNQNGQFLGVIQNTAGTVSLTKQGTGTLGLGGSNTYRGGTTVSAGKLKLLSNTAIPSGNGNAQDAVIVNGTLDLNNFSPTISDLSGSGTVDNTGGGAGTLTDGAGNYFSTFGGIIQNTAGTLALTKVGTASFTLTGANTYSGSTTVGAGSLFVDNTAGSGTGTGSVTVQNGATLGGDGFIGGPVTFVGNSTLSPGDSTGTLTVNNNLTLPNTAAMQFNLGTAGSKVAVTGKLTLGGVLNIHAVGGFTIGTYTLFTYAGSLTLGTLSLGTVPGGYACVLNTKTAGQVSVTVAAQRPRPNFGRTTLAGTNLVFNGTGGGSNGVYYLLTTTNPALPAAQWTVLATNQFDAGGNFSSTNGIVKGQAHGYYLLQTP